MSHSAVAKLGQAAASALLLSQLLGGCAYGEMRQVLRAEVASEADCPELVVKKVPAYAENYQENQYNVTGCGVDRVYTCNDTGGLVKFGSADCKYVAVGNPTPPGVNPPTPPNAAGAVEDEGFGDEGTPGDDTAEPADDSDTSSG